MNHYLFQLQMDGCDDCTGRIQRPVKLHSRINMGHHLRFSRKMPSNPVLGGAHHVWILTPKSEFDAGPGPSITMWSYLLLHIICGQVKAFKFKTRLSSSNQMGHSPMRMRLFVKVGQVSHGMLELWLWLQSICSECWRLLDAWMMKVKPLRHYIQLFSKKRKEKETITYNLQLMDFFF